MSTDNTLKIWDSETGELLKTLEGHTDAVMSVALSQDGKKIISGSYDGSVRTWDMKSKKLLQEFVGGVNGCWQVFLYEPSRIFF